MEANYFTILYWLCHASALIHPGCTRAPHPDPSHLFGRSLSRAQVCDPVDSSTPGFPALHHLLELAQTPVHWVGDAIQPSHPVSSPSLPAFSLPQHQVFSNKSPSHQVAKVFIGASASASTLPMKIQGWWIDWFELLEIQGIPENRSAKGTSYRPRCGGKILIC